MLFIFLSIFRCARLLLTKRPPSRCYRECCPPAAARSIPAQAEATVSDNLRSAVLGRFVPRLARLARSAAVRTTGNGDSLATRTVSQILDPAVPAAAQEARPAGHRRRNPPVGRTSGGGQSAMACATDSWRAEDARHRRIRAHRLPHSSNPPSATDSNLEDLSAQPPRPAGVDRFLHRPDGHYEAMPPAGAGLNNL